MDRENPFPIKARMAGIDVHHEFVPGDLGELIRLHGIQNLKDYGFNHLHEAYCAKVVVDFILDGEPKRSRGWLLKKANEVVGSVLIIERPDNEAQLRLLFVEESVRRLGLGRWLVQESVFYARESGFDSIYLWTVIGLDRARSIYESLGFAQTEQKCVEAWGGNRVEVRYDLELGVAPSLRMGAK
jgi:GNAT superfamily N-acetyltransferase